MNKSGTKVSHCWIPAIMSKDLCHYPVSELLLSGFIEHHYGFGCDNMLEIFAPSSLCVRSLMPWRNLQIWLLPRSFFFARTPKIRRIFRICNVVDRCIWKPFWLFLRILSISGSMQLSSRALYIFPAMEERVIPREILTIPKSPFLGKGGWSLLSFYLSYSGYGGARNVMVIVVGNGHGDSSSNPGREWLHFT